MAKPGRPSPGLDDYLYWQQRLENRGAVRHNILQFSARVLAIVSCGILRFNEIPVEFSL